MTASGQVELQRWTPTADACSLARTRRLINLSQFSFPTRSLSAVELIVAIVKFQPEPVVATGSRL